MILYNLTWENFALVNKEDYLFDILLSIFKILMSFSLHFYNLIPMAPKVADPFAALRAIVKARADARKLELEQQLK